MDLRGKIYLARGLLIVSIALSCILAGCVVGGAFVLHRAVLHSEKDIENELGTDGGVTGSVSNLQQRRMDFAGGVVVHISSSVAVLVLPFILIAMAYFVNRSSAATRLWDWSLIIVVLGISLDWILITSTGDWGW